MTDIELIIKIPEDEYHNILLTGKASFCTVNAIEAGTPLPKGHGDLIDVNRKITIPIYDEQYEEWSEKTLTVLEALNRWSDEGVTAKDVIILADKIESEKYND